MNIFKRKNEFKRDDLSDIIMYRSFHFFVFFFNVSTKRFAFNINKVIRNGRKFLLFENSIFLKIKRFSSGYGTKGYYLEIDKEKDEVVAYSVNLRWKFGYYWQLDYKWTHGNGYFNFYPLLMDTCGQAAIDFTDFRPVDALNSRFEGFNNESSGALKVIAEYLGGFPAYKTIQCCLSYRQYIEYVFNKYCKKEGKKDLTIFKPLPQIDEEAFLLMKKITIKSISDRTSCGFLHAIPQRQYGYVQNVDNSVVLRIFVPIFDFNYPIIEKTNISFVEYKRYFIDETNSVDMDAKNIIIAGCDKNFDGTCLQYVNHIFLKKIAELSSMIDEICKFIWIYRADLFNECFDERFNKKLEQQKLFRVIYKISKEPAIEKVINLDHTGTLLDSILLRAEIFLRDEGTEYVMNQLLWKCDFTEQKVHKILKIPHGMLEYVMKNYNKSFMYFIRNIKFMFSGTDEAVKYLINMNEHDWKYLIVLFDSFDSKYCEAEASKFELLTERPVRNFVNLIHMLIKLFGCKRWRQYFLFVENVYFDHTRDIPFNAWLRRYESYIENLYECRNVLKEIEFNSNFVKKMEANDVITTMAMSLKNIDYSDDILDRFKELHKKYSDYFYEDKDYVITFPANPISVITEGINLNHCVANFIGPIIKEETIILFIRRKKCPEKSFFTLEVRNGEIRQCHGFNNSNTDESLKRFLQDYCRKKSIIYNDGTMQYAAE